MRIYRLALLQTYFSAINKNKKKALLFINIGIFLSIFALSTAIISFYIEKKISDEQNNLLILQLDFSESSQLISSIDGMFTMYESSINYEEINRVEKQFLSETKLGNKNLSEKDFYAPFIYQTGLILKDIERLTRLEDFDPFNINDEYNIIFIKMIENIWSEDEKKKFVDSITNVEKPLKEIKKINFEEYKLDEIPSLKDIELEIINYKDNHINKFNWTTSKISNDYFTCIDFTFALQNWFKNFSKFLKSVNKSNESEIEIINQKIISLSKKEKNIILATFFFQFIIFFIIQIFEISSLNQTIKKKIK